MSITYLYCSNIGFKPAWVLDWSQKDKILAEELYSYPKGAVINNSYTKDELQFELTTWYKSYLFRERAE